MFFLITNSSTNYKINCSMTEENKTGDRKTTMITTANLIR